MLNIDSHIKKYNGKLHIFDVIRKKYVLFTPEESVRQEFLKHLLIDLKYPKALICVEATAKNGPFLRRADIVVYHRNGRPLLLIECKANHIQLGANCMKQLLHYNHFFQARCAILTNGKQLVGLYQPALSDKKIFISEIPTYEELCGAAILQE